MFHIKRRLTSAVILMVVVTLMSGCGGGMASVLSVARAAAILPDRWVPKGNMITILADVIGDGIREVRALIKKYNSSEVVPIILTRNSSGQYEGAVAVDESPVVGDPVTYSVVVTATDTTGNTDSSNTVSFDVPSTDDPAPAQ